MTVQAEPKKRHDLRCWSCGKFMSKRELYLLVIGVGVVHVKATCMEDYMRRAGRCEHRQKLKDKCTYCEEKGFRIGIE